MTHLLLLTLVFGAIGAYFMTPVERTRLLGRISEALRKAKDAATVGLAVGISVARELSTRIPHFRRVATAAVVLVAAVTLYSVVVPRPTPKEPMNIRPEIDRVVAVESHTTRLYEQEVVRFRKGRIKAAGLADVIEKAILPELRGAADRLRTLRDVPPEQQNLVASAEQFLKLRDESWRVRAKALHKSDMSGLRQADTKEAASLQTFHLLKLPG